ncbi:hypothetical protein [Fodinicola feengrottensis]|uniref:hypothetical protein n=1 Tax=Fodinicola feengrottensis TaxID=435914 RepID=UPI0013D274E8|nr:hypothetical protein [Fodinicola feengrottensis]
MIRPLVRPVAGPATSLGQGGPQRHGFWLRPIGALATGFLLSAAVIFALTLGIGAAVGVPLVPSTFRLLGAVALVLVLCGFEIAALRGKTVCRLSWRRQTPKKKPDLQVRPGTRPTAVGPGHRSDRDDLPDLGGHLGHPGLALLQLAPVWTGVAYGIGFAAPLAAATVLPRWRPPLADGTIHEPHWIAVALSRRLWVPQAINLVVMVAVLALIVNRMF